MTENEKLYLLIKFAILRGTEKNDLQKIKNPIFKCEDDVLTEINLYVY